jgi:hypothetical protein
VSPVEMLTPEMLEVILPTLGFSIILNVVLIAALLIRSFYQHLLDQLQNAWIGVRLMLGERRKV